MTENNSEKCVNIDDKMKCGNSEKSVAINMLVFGVLPKNQPDSDELQVFVNRPEGKGDWFLPSELLSFDKSTETDNGESVDNRALDDAVREVLKGKWDLGNCVYGKTSSSITRYTIKPNPDLVCQLDSISVTDTDNGEEVETYPYMTLVSIREKNLYPSEIHPNFARWMPVSKLIKTQDDDFVSGEEGIVKSHFGILKSGLLQLFQELKNRRIGGSKDVFEKEELKKYVEEEIVRKIVDGESIDQLKELDDYYMLPSEFEYSDLVHINDVVYRSLGMPMGKPYMRELLSDVIRKEEGGKYRFNVKKYGWYKCKFRYNHARANIAADVVVFGVLPDKDELHVFVQRDKKGDKWSLPGRFMHCGVNPDDEIAPNDNWNLKTTKEKALKMEWPIRTMLNGMVIKPSEVYKIEEKTDLICQLEAMSRVDRDSRNKRVVSIPYMTLIRVEKDKMPSQILSEGAEVARWMPLSELINNDLTPGKTKLDHDHFDILKDGLKRLSQEVRTRPVGKGMLPDEFDISSLIHIYNVILHAMGVSVDRSNLRKLLLEIRGVIKEVNNDSSSGKTGTTYQFVDEKYSDYKKYLNFGFNQNQRKQKNKE